MSDIFFHKPISDCYRCTSKIAHGFDAVLLAVDNTPPSDYRPKLSMNGEDRPHFKEGHFVPPWVKLNFNATFFSYPGKNVNNFFGVLKQSAKGQAKSMPSFYKQFSRQSTRG